MNLSVIITILPCLILASIYTYIIVKNQLLQIDEGSYFAVTYLFVLCFGCTFIFTNVFLEELSYVRSCDNYYFKNNDVDLNEVCLLWNYYTKEIPNLERFQKLQNFTLKLDLLCSSL